MKKLSSFFVLMLIALMLFVSCNGSTPTKEESNSSSNGSTPTVTERAATDADYTLFANLSNVLMNDLVSNRIELNEALPEGCTLSQDESSLTFNSCEFDSYNLDGSPLHVKLNGSATIKRDQANSVDYYTCNFTEGSSLGGTNFTTNLEFNTNNVEMSYNFTSATINGIKINGLSELANRKYSREATDEDKELTKKLIRVFDYIKTLTPDQITALGTSKNLIISNNSDSVVYAFNNWEFEYSNTSYLLNGGVELIRMDSNTFTINCNFLNNGTKIDGINHSVIAEGTQTIDNDNNKDIFTFQNAIIDYTLITNLEVEVPILTERDATDADKDLILNIFSVISFLLDKNSTYLEGIGVVLKDGTYTFTNEKGPFKVHGNNFKLIGSITETETSAGSNIYEYEWNLQDVTIDDGSSHKVNASLTHNYNDGYRTYDVHEAIIDGKKVNKLTEMLNNSNEGV